MTPVPSLILAAGLLALALTAPVVADPIEVRSVGTAGADEILDTHTRVVDLAQTLGLDALVERLADRRVVFVGESHDRYEDHLNQLAIIEGLHRQGIALAIGMEPFQQPFQAALDAYLRGEIDEHEMLRRTDYFERWRYDYRLYRPILRFARDQGLPVIALNLPRELTEKVGRGGIAALSEEERARLPAEIDRSDAAYRARAQAVFEQHPLGEGRQFEHFLEVQLLWDEGMADRAARYLADNPQRSLVVLAGAGHLEYGQGIPKRLLRRVQVPSAVVMNGSHRELDPGLADYLLFPRRAELPAAGLLGVALDTESPGDGVEIKDFGEASGAKAAGMEKGDRILRIDTQPIASYADIRVALLDSRPGQKVAVEASRSALLGGTKRLTFEVELR